MLGRRWPWLVVLSYSLYTVILVSFFRQLTIAHVELPKVVLGVILVGGVFVHAIWAQKINKRKK